MSSVIPQFVGISVFKIKGKQVYLIRPVQVFVRDGPNYVYLELHDADRLSVGNFWRNFTGSLPRYHGIDGYLSNIQGKLAGGARQVPYIAQVKARDDGIPTR